MPNIVDWNNCYHHYIQCAENGGNKENMEITSEHELILAYISDYIHRNLETNFFNEKFYCTSVKNVTVDEFINDLKHDIKDHILRGV